MSGGWQQLEGASPRVTHVVPTLFGEDRGIVGGAERFAYELARHMAKLVPTALVSFGEHHEQWRDDDLEIRVLGGAHAVRGQRTNPISWGLAGALRGADVIHVHQQHVVASSASALLARLRRQRIFASDLGGGGWDISGYISTDRWYDGHLHISEYSRRVFGHDDNPLAHVIYGGVDTVKFSPEPEAKKGGEVLFVGRLLAHKGIDVLIDAIDQDMELHVIGRPYDGSYLELLKERAAGKRVLFRHTVSDSELVEAYRSAACLVLPSVYRDVFGNESKVPELLGQTLLEGMASGIPAICTDVASMPEVVVDTVTGFIVPPNDPVALHSRLQDVLRDAARAAKMGNAGRERVLERFTWQSIVRNCLDIYSRNAVGGVVP